MSNPDPETAIAELIRKALEQYGALASP
jgi:hypothetical protein